MEIAREDLSDLISGAQAAYTRLEASLPDMTDSAAREPSLLPDWSRGHVLAHLARNADSHVRLLAAVEEGQLVEQYVGGAEGRASDIEAGAGRAVQALVEDVAASAQRLADLWREEQEEEERAVTKAALWNVIAHTWTGEHAVTGKWKFLTCSIVNRDKPPKVPILSIPTPIGYDMAKQVAHMVHLVRPLVQGIRLALFDRGFYGRPLMKMLDDLDVPYLIFVPRTKQVGRELDAMQAEAKKTVRYEFSYERDKTTHRGQTNLALLKQVFDPRRRKPFDWAFATNVDDFDLETIVPQYKGRWRIETGFRVQDQASVRSSSKRVEVRYFYFAFEQALQFAWGALYKDEVPYKRLVQELVYASHARLERAQPSGPRTRPGP